MTGAAYGCIICMHILQRLPQATAKTEVKIESHFTMRKGVRPEKVDTLVLTVWSSLLSTGCILYAAVFAQSGTLEVEINQAVVVLTHG